MHLQNRVGGFLSLAVLSLLFAFAAPLLATECDYRHTLCAVVNGVNADGVQFPAPAGWTVSICNTPDCGFGSRYDGAVTSCDPQGQNCNHAQSTSLTSGVCDLTRITHWYVFAVGPDNRTEQHPDRPVRRV